MARREKRQPTFIYNISINGAPPVNMDTLSPERRAEIVTKLCDNFARSLGYEPVEEKEN